LGQGPICHNHGSWKPVQANRRARYPAGFVAGLKAEQQKLVLPELATDQLRGGDAPGRQPEGEQALHETANWLSVAAGDR
jgi:hypothetical protein